MAASLLFAAVTLAPLVGTTLDDGRASEGVVPAATTPPMPPLRARPLTRL
jgi:hypothetical protein